MLNRRRAVVAFSALAMSLSALVSAAPVMAQDLTKATLRLKWLPQAQFAGFYVAVEKGYYKDEGIDLTINPGGPNLLTENLVATGADTFGLASGTEGFMAARDKNLPILCIGVAHQVTPFFFVTKKDGPIKTLQDFKGKNVTTWFNGAQYVLYAMLAKEKVDASEVKILPQQVSMTPFIDGQTDVATATKYNEFYVVASRLGRDNVRTFLAEDYGVTFPRDVLIVSEKVAKDNPELVKKFLRASIKGWKQAFADEKGAIDTIMKIAPTLDRAHQEFMLKEIKTLMLAGKAATEGLFTVDLDAIQKTHELLINAKVISKPVDLKTFDGGFLAAIPVADRKL